jgi:hypothetical protein
MTERPQQEISNGLARSEHSLFRVACSVIPYSILMLLLLAASPVRADDALSIEATISDDSVLVGDILTIQITAVGRVDGQVNIVAPAIDGLTEVNRSRSEGTSISWTSAGQSITREVTLSIEYQADRAGEIAIPPFVAKLGQHEARTKASTIQAHGSPPPPKGPAAPGKVTPPENAERQLFVRYVLDRNSAYLGQQILMDLMIFALPGSAFSVDEVGPPPELDGFWREIVDQPQRLNRTVEMVDGRRYDVYRVWRVAMFPLAKGMKAVPPAAITFSTGRSLFSSGRRIRRQTAPVELDILPLPTEGRPQDFSNNNVGTYSLKASVDHTSVPAGKAVVLQLELGGRGNIKNARLPEIGEIQGFRAFPPTTSDKVNTGLAGIDGTKTAQILLMPTVGGRLEIPRFDLTVFDPESAEYKRLTTESKRLTTESIRIAVEGDPTAEMARTTVEPEVSQPEPERIDRASLKPLRFRSKLSENGAPIWKQPPFAALMIGPPFLFALALALEAMIARAKRDTPTARKKAASRRARERLTAAKDAADKGAVADAWAELREAILELGTNKCGVALRGMTLEEIDHALAERGADEALRREITAELEAADHARFGVSMKPADLERWTELLLHLDTWSPKEPSP